MFDEADRKNQNPGVRRIILITDLQEGSRLEGLQGYEWPRGIEVNIEPIKPKRSTNAGIQLVSSADEALSDSPTTGVRVRVSNSADAQREQFQLRSGNSGGGTQIYVPPGQSRTVSLTNASASVGNRIILEGDDADFDNTLYVIPPRTEQIKIIFLGQDSENDPSQALYYLKRAFQNTLHEQVEISSKPAGVPLSPTDSVGAQLVIISDALPEERIQFVQQWLASGKSVLLMMKTPAAGNTLGRLTGVSSLAAEEAKVGNYAMLGQIDFQHPLFGPFADPRFSDFTKIHFWKYRRVGLSQIPGARVIAKFDNPQADPAILQIPIGPGTIWAFTFGWFPSDSQFALSSKFVPLLYSLLEQSGAIKAQSFQYLVGDPVDLSAFGSGQALTIRKPDGKEVQVPANERFTQTDMPGIYNITSTQPPSQFAVNLAAEESKTAPMPVEILQKLGVPLKVPVQQTSKEVRRAAATREHLLATELENRQKLWRWLIVAAVVVLMVETWLAGRLTRRAALIEDSI